MNIITDIIYDETDLLKVNPEVTNGRNLVIGLDPDSQLVELVDLDTSEILKSKKLMEDNLLSTIEEICMEMFNKFSYDEEVMDKYLIAYLIPEEELI